MICHKSDDNSINISSEFLINEKVVILPTDTVYGFSAIVNENTDKKIREIKGRSEKKPFIQLIANPSDIYEYTTCKIPQKIFDLWPGPLTVIVPDIRLQDREINTTAFRCPGDEWLRTVIKECGSPIYSTSVNRSGSPVLTKIADICSEFESEVALIVSEGDSKTSVPSTIVKLEDNGYSVVREGAVKL